MKEDEQLAEYRLEILHHTAYVYILDFEHKDLQSASSHAIELVQKYLCLVCIKQLDHSCLDIK